MAQSEIEQLNAKLAQLEAETEQLRLLQNLSKSLNQADGYDELATGVINILTAGLGIDWAIIGQVLADQQLLSGWMASTNQPLEQLIGKQAISLSTAGGPIALAVLQGKSSSAENATVGAYEIHPLIWGQHPLGVILLPAPINPSHKNVLAELLEQTAVRLGIMQMRLRRARATAIEEERNRIAIDMHDTVSQSLFGMIFSLDACLKMSPKESEQIFTELERIKQTAEGVRGEIRQTIHDMWVEMTADRFQRDIQSYLFDVLQAADLAIDFDIRGDFSSVSPEVHRTLYRVCQEALTNTVHHAAASDARVCLDVQNERVGLIVRDNGRGFEPIEAMRPKAGNEHFGILGIQERIQLLGGTCDFFSRPGHGMSLVIDVPVMKRVESRE